MVVISLFKELWHFTYPFHQKLSVCYSAPPQLFFLSLIQNLIYLFLSKVAKYIISDVYVNYLEKTLQKYEYWILHPISKVYLYNSTETSLRQECFFKSFSTPKSIWCTAHDHQMRSICIFRTPCTKILFITMLYHALNLPWKITSYNKISLDPS